MAGPGHLLSLKVMRVSRPSLASAWEPFYSSSPSFSAHSTTSIVSLQGHAALSGHPKTLRDLSNASEVLMLPSSFGAIQLGETFTSCLSVNNDSDVEVEFVTLTVEIQTATMKTVLAEFGGEGERLAAGQSLEKIVSHEIKELGQHALACTISYGIPKDARHVAPIGTETGDSGFQVFRKFYKFAVTNPLSVKTKVHVPRSPSALFSRNEREKVFLEIHIQNLTQDPMWLERMQLECADGWHAEDPNVVDSKAPGASAKESIFSGSMALMQPQDMRQYVYILSPTAIAPIHAVHQPGTSIPLGRLDITWKSSFGEPGRLLTSMLSRRIPLVQATQGPPAAPPKQPVSAIPLHLQRSASVANNTPPRPRSPQLNQRPTSPPANPVGPLPYRPASPFRNRSLVSSPTVSSPTLPPPSPDPNARRQEDIEVDLVVTDLPREDVRVEKPFKIACTLTVAAPIPKIDAPRSRLLTMVVQHVHPPRSQTAARSASTSATIPIKGDIQSPRVSSSGFSTPSPFATPQRAEFRDIFSQKLTVTSPQQADYGSDISSAGVRTPEPGRDRAGPSTVILPSPFPSGEAPIPTDVSHLGRSAIFLSPFELSPPESGDSAGTHVFTHQRNTSSSTTNSDADSELGRGAAQSAHKVLVSQNFELTYLPLKTGFVTVGGLRVVLADDQLVGEDGTTLRQRHPEVRILKEWNVIAEVWVNS